MSILILTECSALVGLGHVVRCSALARVFVAEGCKVSILIQCDVPTEHFARDAGCPVISSDWIDHPEEFISSLTDDTLLIIDSYRYGEDFAVRLVERTQRVVWWDDENRLAYPAGIILNPALDSKQLYGNANGVGFMLGPEFQALRPAFIRDSPFVVKSQVSKTLILTGGSKIASSKRAIASILAQSTVPGDLVSLDDYRRVPDEFLDDQRIRSILNEVDIVVSSGGQSLIECVSVGVPTIGVELISNQRMNLLGWERIGAISNVGGLGSHEFENRLLQAHGMLRSAELRSRYSRICRSALDGHGGERIVRYLKELGWLDA